jgi:hypothetical protein
MQYWLVENWFDVLSSIGIIGSLLFTAFALHSETKTRRVANLLSITANHQGVWKEILHAPQLGRVIDPAANISKEPVSPMEELFVGLIIAHVNSVYYATHDSLVIKWENWHQDVKQFFSLPIPKAVWTKTKLLQNHDFAAFIEVSLKQP